MKVWGFNARVQGFVWVSRLGFRALGFKARGFRPLGFNARV